MKKWIDQSWQLTIHVAMTLWNVSVLSDPQVNWKWWNDTPSNWEFCHNNPTDEISSCMAQPVLEIVRRFYLIQLAIWAYTSFFHAFFEEPRRDHFAMFFHHIATLGLIIFSYIFRYSRIGVLVLLVHDISDIPLDLVKMVNYLEWEICTIIGYVVTLSSWAYWRFYQFPFRIINCTLFEAYAIAPNGKWLWEMNFALICLVFLHIYWFYLLVAVGLRMLFSKPKEAAAAEYEGTDDD